MKLSVLLVTYNHARFVEQAVRSALAQDTPFEYEVVVADDCSTDGTTAIIERVAREFPDRLRFIPKGRHVGVQENFVSGYTICTGEYLALLDGDDYWLSPYKLRRQVDFLDQHAECTLCFHNALIVHDDGSPEQLACSSARTEPARLEDLLIENVIPTSSAVYRHGLLRQFPDWARDSITWDWALHLLHAQYGRAGYLADAMAVTRRHAGGLWTGTAPSSRVKAAVALLEHFNRHMNGKYDAIVRAAISRWQSISKIEELQLAFKKVEWEWQQQVAKAQLERAAAVAELAQRAAAAERDREEFARRLAEVNVDKEGITAAREASLQEIPQFRQALAEQTRAVDDLRIVIEGAVARNDAVTSDTTRELGVVNTRLSEIHRWMDVQRTRDLVQATVPLGSTVLVVSKGDPELLQFESRTGWHFPRIQDGSYAGAHPADSEAATAHLEDLRRRGAQYLVFPGSSLWWLDYYQAFRQHLDKHYRTVLRREGSCLIFALVEHAAEQRAPELVDGSAGLAFR